MTLSNERTIEVLNGLIETCKDGEQGFRTAADGIANSGVKSLFNDFSRERAQCAAELQVEVRRLGGDPEKTGSVSGSMHRGWINIKSVVTGKDEGMIIAEAERGEDVAVKMYQDALGAGLPPAAEALVQRQFTKVKQAHDRVRDLERAETRG